MEIITRTFILVEISAEDIHLDHFDTDLYRFLPADMIGNFDGRLFSSENTKSKQFEMGQTANIIKTIFKY